MREDRSGWSKDKTDRIFWLDMAGLNAKVLMLISLTYLLKPYAIVLQSIGTYEKIKN